MKIFLVSLIVGLQHILNTYQGGVNQREILVLLQLYILYHFRHKIFVNVIIHHMYHVEKDCLHSPMAQMCTAQCSSCWLWMDSCLVTAIWISGSLHIFISQCVYTLQSGCCSIHCPRMLPVFTMAEVVTRYSPTFYWPKPLQPPSFQCFKHSHIFWSPKQPNWMMETGPS